MDKIANIKARFDEDKEKMSYELEIDGNTCKAEMQIKDDGFEVELFGNEGCKKYLKQILEQNK